MVLMSCGRTDKPVTQQFNTDWVYFNYTISAEEGDDNLTVLVRFLMGEDDEAVSIPGGASVMLDDEILNPDSSKKAGTFYEVHKPITSFTYFCVCLWDKPIHFWQNKRTNSYGINVNY